MRIAIVYHMIRLIYTILSDVLYYFGGLYEIFRAISERSQYSLKGLDILIILIIVVRINTDEIRERILEKGSRTP